jgi:hypothetical protein
VCVCVCVFVRESGVLRLGELCLALMFFLRM